VCVCVCVCVMWRRRVGSINLRPKHISCYGLSSEPYTLYSMQIERGEISAPDSNTIGAMMELTYELTEKEGLNAYEISNFAYPGNESLHNLGYWHYEPFLGLGCGASGQYHVNSQDGAFLIREINEKKPSTYMQTVVSGEFFTTEAIIPSMAMSEYLMMGLRLKKGISIKGFESVFGQGLMDVYSKEVTESIENGLLDMDSSSIRPTTRGFMLNDTLVSSFIL